MDIECDWCQSVDAERWYTKYLAFLCRMCWIGVESND